MANRNGNNAYKYRFEGNAVRNRPDRMPPVHEQSNPAQKHIRPNMTVKLNKTKERKPSLAQGTLTKNFRSLDPVQVRMVIIGVSTCLVVAFFLFCNLFFMIKGNELDNTIAEQEAKLAGLENDYNNLVLGKDKFMSDAALEEYAKHRLGMQRRDSHQVTWFEVPWEDDFED